MKSLSIVILSAVEKSYLSNYQQFDYYEILHFIQNDTFHTVSFILNHNLK